MVSIYNLNLVARQPSGSIAALALNSAKCWNSLQLSKDKIDKLLIETEKDEMPWRICKEYHSIDARLPNRWISIFNHWWNQSILINKYALFIIIDWFPMMDFQPLGTPGLMAPTVKKFKCKKFPGSHPHVPLPPRRHVCNCPSSKSLFKDNGFFLFYNATHAFLDV